MMNADLLAPAQESRLESVFDDKMDDIENRMVNRINQLETVDQLQSHGKPQMKTADSGTLGARNESKPSALYTKSLDRVLNSLTSSSSGSSDLPGESVLNAFEYSSADLAAGPLFDEDNHSSLCNLSTQKQDSDTAEASEEEVI